MNKQSTTNTLSVFAMLLAVALGASPAHAHTGKAGKNADANTKASFSTDEHAFGRQGTPKNATRTIAIDMSDTMRFGPEDITVKAGETIKFVITNKGQMMHEMVIGTMDELKAHGDLMKKHPDMEHDEPYMSHVGPGKKQQMVWQFTKPGQFYYACLIPGHFEAGMVGKITVKKG